MNLKRRKAFYTDWWDKAAQWRSAASTGCAAACPAARAPTSSIAGGVKGTLFVNEILEVRPGTALDFLAAVVAERVPLMREYGHEPTGIYEVLSNPHEVVMVWATDIPAQLRLRANRDAALGFGDEGEGDDRLVAWERTSATYTGGDTHS